MAKWFDDNKFFIPAKFRFWFQSVVQKTINQYIYSNEFLVTIIYLLYLKKLKYSLLIQVHYSTSGPAITLHVVKETSGHRIEFSVDLVPVLRMYNRHPPSGISQTHIRHAENSSGRVINIIIFI